MITRMHFGDWIIRIKNTLPRFWRYVTDQPPSESGQGKGGEASKMSRKKRRKRKKKPRGE